MRIFVGFSRPRFWFLNPLSMTIMAVEKIRISHCYIRIERNDGVYPNVVYEAAWPRSKWSEYKEWAIFNKKVIEFQLGLTSEEQSRFIMTLYSQLDRPYAISQIIGLIFKLLKCKYYGDIGNNNEKKNICTEIIGNCLFAIGFRFKSDTDALFIRDIFKSVLFSRKRI